MIKEDSEKKYKKTLWILSLLLLILVFITTVILALRIRSFSNDDRNTVPVFEEVGFSVDDDNKVWKTESDINIFKSSFDSTADDLLLESSDGDKIIAPGASNEYTFNLKNVGKISIDYIVSMEAILKFNEKEVNFNDFPVLVRIKNYSDEYYFGSEDEWVSIEKINDFVDDGTLGVKNYAYYTLEWKWMPEGSDKSDTLFGSLANISDVDLTIKINTTSIPSDIVDAPGGIPQDDLNGVPVFKDETSINDNDYTLIIIIVLSILIFFVIYFIRRTYLKYKKNNN